MLESTVRMLPTPAARDWKSGESNLIGTNARPLNEVVVNLLPTPRARDSKGCDPNPRGVDLNEAVRLLPTPTASNPNDGESLESWEARRQRNLEKGINGNGQGTPLAIAVKLLPTPMAGDAKGTRKATAGRSKDNPNVNEGWTLSDVVFSGQMSNPPAPPVDAKSPSTTPEDSAPAAPHAPTPNSGGRSATTTTAPSAPMKLMPTPRATDGTKGGPNQRGSKGDLMLPSLAAQLLPTPTASATEKSTRALTSSTGNGRRTGGGQSSSLGLTEIAKLATGERPANLPADKDLPPSSRRIVEQFSNSATENPTSTGAITNPPSDGGNESSDDQPPGQLTLLDD